MIQPSPNLQNQAPSLEEASDYDARCLRSNYEVREPPTPTYLCVSAALRGSRETKRRN